MIPARAAHAAMLIAIVVAVTPATAAPGGHAVRIEHRPADDAPALGPRDAPVTIELFFTPGAPSQHDAYRTLRELQRRHPTRVRAVFRPVDRNTNLPDIALAAHQRGKFFELMETLSAGPNAPSPAQTIELAVKIGLSRAVAERAHLDDSIIATLEENRHRSFRLGTTFIPEMVINGQPIGRRFHAGSAVIGDLEREYQAAYEEALRAQAQGLPRRALVRWGGQREMCGDDDEEDDDSPPLDPTGLRALEAAAAGTEDPLAPLQEPETPPRYAWRLARLLHRGTGCRATQHLAATLDESMISSPPRGDTAALLATPLPTAGLPSFGPGDAPVPIFVVCNLRGRFCLDQIDLARRVAEHHPGEVRVVWVPWVDLALDGVERDLTLAQAALCAHRDGDGWGFLRAVMTAGLPARGRLDLAAIAAAAGLDVESVVSCATAEPVEARVAVQAARDAGIGWSPTVVIGGRAYLGGFSDDRRASERVAAELAPGLLEALVPAP